MTTRKNNAIHQLLTPFMPFLDDPAVSEICMNKPEEVIAKSIAGTSHHRLPTLTSSYMQSLFTALITYNGLSNQSINYVILPGGERGTIITPPAVIDGTLSFVVRKHTPTVKTLEELEQETNFNNCKDVSFNIITKEQIDNLAQNQNECRLEPNEIFLLNLKRTDIKTFLEECVIFKRNIIIAGKTGSGKTTFARSLIEKVPLSERIITIEDVHELILPNHTNKVHMLYGTGTGRMSADDCLTACLRQSPDRIFLAELRGDETWEYLNSLNTGHPGSITTIHANSALQTFDRLAVLIKKSKVGHTMNMDTINHILHTTIDVVLYMEDRVLKEVFYDPVFKRTTSATDATF